MIRHHETDVLVVGGGLTAAFAAIKASETGATVTLVDRGFFGRSGCSAVASGVMRAFFPGDDLENWIANSGGGTTTRPFANPEVLRKVTLLSGEIIKLMEQWGVRWVKDGGEILRTASADVGGPANVMMDGGGPPMMMAMRAEVLRRGVTVINRVQVNDLLTVDGKAPTSAPVVGALGLNTRTGEINCFHAKTIVMATGPMMVPFHSRDGAGRGRGMPIDLSGDGHAAMLRAGAIMGKFELGSMGIVPWHMFAAPGLEMLFGIGGTDIFVNAKGERFLGGKDIRRDMRGRSAVGVSLAHEMKEGRGPVYLDVTFMTPDERRLLYQVIPIVMKSFEAAGFDPARDRIPYSIIVMATHSVGGGGAAIDARMGTSIPRLYAGGNCTDGAYMSMQQNLPDCAAMGYWAGENAGAEALKIDALAVDDEQLARLVERLQSPLNSSGNLSYDDLRARLNELYAEKMGMTFSAKRGREILSFLERMVNVDIPNARAAEPREIARIHSVRNFCDTLDTAVRAILHRTESRGNVLREDYPDIDNENWLAYTRLRRGPDGRTKVWEEPVPSIVAAQAKRSRSRHPFFQTATK